MWAAAQECKAKFATIQSIDRIEPDGRVHLTYSGSGADREAFLACYQEGIKRRLGSSGGLATGRVAAASRNVQRTVVPIRKVGNAMFLTARANDQHAATLLLDTGATSTILTPALATRLGIAPGPGARRRTFNVAGGGSFSVPIVRLAALRIGDYVVEELDVGVYNMLPHATNVDGVLGNDFLQHFRVLVDGDQRALILELKSTTPAAAPAPSAPSTPAATYPVPTWSVGDQWTYRADSADATRTFTYAVRRGATIDGIDYWVLRSGPREFFYRREDLAVSFERVNDNPERQYEPPMRPFSWPLAVTRSWEDRYTILRTGHAPINRAFTVSVEGEDEIRVPAGSFRALRIVRRQVGSGTLAVEGWYAPDVKFWVKYHEHLATGSRTGELTAYVVK